MSVRGSPNLTTDETRTPIDRRISNTTTSLTIKRRCLPFSQRSKLINVTTRSVTYQSSLESRMIRTFRFGSVSAGRLRSSGRRFFTSPPPKESPTPGSPPPPPLSGPAASRTQGIGTGKGVPGSYIKDRGPVSWPSLFLVGIAAASIVAYYNIERERRLESAMGRVVSSESGGWTPNPDVMAPRKFKLTPWGWFPEEDAFGPCKSVNLSLPYLRKGPSSYLDHHPTASRVQ